MNDKRSHQRSRKGGRFKNNGKNGRHGGGGNGQKNIGQIKQHYDKHLNQAKELLSRGEKIDAEYHLQCADHYYRLLSEANYFTPKQPSSDREESSSEENNADENMDEEEKNISSQTNAPNRQAGQSSRNSQTRNQSRHQDDDDGEEESVADLPFLQVPSTSSAEDAPKKPRRRTSK